MNADEFHPERGKESVSIPRFPGAEEPAPVRGRWRRWVWRGFVGLLLLLIICQVVFWPWIKDNVVAQTIGVTALVVCILGMYLGFKMLPHLARSEGDAADKRHD
jgi:hypothetical protein